MRCCIITGARFVFNIFNDEIMDHLYSGSSSPLAPRPRSEARAMGNFCHYSKLLISAPGTRTTWLVAVHSNYLKLGPDAV